MPYPESLKNLIKKVEETRPERVEKKKSGWEFPSIDVDDRDSLLKEFHPDYREGTRREISVGPNKGYSISNEIVDMLEARSRS